MRLYMGPTVLNTVKLRQWFWTLWQYIFRKLFFALKWQTILIFIFWFYKFASFSSKWNPRIICETHQEENYDTQMCCDTPFEKHIIQMTISVLAFLSNDKTTCMTYVNFITEDGLCNKNRMFKTHWIKVHQVDWRAQKETWKRRKWNLSQVVFTLKFICYYCDDRLISVCTIIQCIVSKWRFYTLWVSLRPPFI